MEEILPLDDEDFSQFHCYKKLIYCLNLRWSRSERTEQNVGDIQILVIPKLLKISSTIYSDSYVNESRLTLGDTIGNNIMFVCQIQFGPRNMILCWIINIRDFLPSLHVTSIVGFLFFHR